MTELLMAASVGRWFMYLSLGLSTSHAHCALVPLFLYARTSAKVAVGGMGNWGLMVGTGWRIGLLAMSRAAHWRLREYFD